MKRYEEALASFERVLTINPNSSSAYYNKACCYSLQHQPQLAVANLQRAITIDNKLKEEAETDNSFDPIRSEPLFQDLLN